MRAPRCKAVNSTQQNLTKTLSTNDGEKIDIGRKLIIKGKMSETAYITFGVPDGTRLIKKFDFAVSINESTKANKRRHTHTHRQTDRKTV